MKKLTKQRKKVNNMKTFINVLGYLMAGWLFISTIVYWTDIYGGIGLFGSLLTIPFSTVAAIIRISLSGLEGFIGMALWIFVTFVLITYGEEN